MSVEHSQRTISVTGVGRVKASADILVLSLAVETQDVTASEALTKNNEQASAVLSALQDHGIQERDIQTTQLSIDPVTERQDQNNIHPPMIVAYRVRNGLSVTLREIPRAGVVIDAAVQAGGGASVSMVSRFRSQNLPICSVKPESGLSTMLKTGPGSWPMVSV